MNSQTTALKQNPFIFQLDKKAPMRFAWVSLIFIYVLQYPLSQLLPDATPIPQYDWSVWLLSYSFVVLSVAILISTLYVGLSGRSIKIYPSLQRKWSPNKRMSFTWVMALFSVFGFWSYLMVKLNIGMTIWTDFEQLPYRITGILFYGRLFIQPIILAYVAVAYVNSKLKWIVYLLLIALGAWVSLSSGSRFAGIIFALPLLLLFSGKSRYLAFGLPLLIFIVIATLSRSFYLPMVVGDSELMQIYANEAHQSSITENIFLLPISYIIVRTMGINEVVMTLNFGNTTPGLFDSLQVFMAYFLPFISSGSSVSIKNIYGLSDDAFGGFGLDMFSNFWVMFGGDPFLYSIGLGLMGWLLGKTYRMFAIGMARFGMKGFGFLVFIILFILIFEGRGNLFPALFMLGWFFSCKRTPDKIFSLLGMILPRRIFLPKQSCSRI
jgi:hypothetical protein